MDTTDQPKEADTGIGVQLTKELTDDLIKLTNYERSKAIEAFQTNHWQHQPTTVEGLLHDVTEGNDECLQLQSDFLHQALVNKHLKSRDSCLELAAGGQL